MAGPRFLRQRRASLHSFKAVQIAEVLEARRLLAAVSDDGFIEAPQPEAAAAEAVVTENFVVTSEEYTEECLPEYYLEGEVAIDGPENSEFNDTLLMENGGTDEGTWTDFVDVGSEVTGDISSDDTLRMEFLPEDPIPSSGDDDLAVGEEFKPQVMLFSSLRGGSGVVLRALALSVPDAAPQITSPAPLSNFVPEQRRVESVFAGRNVVLGQSGERAADARLVSMRTESRTATPGISASVVPKRSTLLTGSQSESAPRKDAASVDSEAAAVSGLATRKQVLR